MLPEIYLLALLFFTIALFYASAGFGGGSSYLAVLALFPTLAFTEMRLLALLCNITVVSGSVYLFYKQNLLKIQRILPLILLSVPFAYLGGTLRIRQDFFFLLLGLTLFAAAVAMLFLGKDATQKVTLSHPVSEYKSAKFSSGIIGSGIGFLSGLVGIGGGIFLSPLLYLLRWGRAKQIAACTAVFILVNSAAGLIGQIATHGFTLDPQVAAILMSSVFLGGQIGARLTVFKLSPVLVKRITAILILAVSIRLLYKASEAYL